MELKVVIARIIAMKALKLPPFNEDKEIYRVSQKSSPPNIFNDIFT